jgi:hypothetical protein
VALVFSLYFDCPEVFVFGLAMLVLLATGRAWITK